MFFSGRSQGGSSVTFRAVTEAHEPPCGWKMSQYQPTPMSWITSSGREASFSSAAAAKASGECTRRTWWATSGKAAARGENSRETTWISCPRWASFWTRR